jgi:hypothetical protein
MKGRLRKLGVGLVSLTTTALGGCLSDGGPSEQEGPNVVTVTREFGSESSNESTSGDDSSQSTGEGDVSVGPRSGTTTPDSRDADIQRISFADYTLFVHLAQQVSIDTVVVVSPFGSQLARQEPAAADESVAFDLVEQTHGELYPPGEYSLYGYRTDSGGAGAAELVEAHTVSLEPELQLSSVDNVGEPGKVRLSVSNTGTAPYPVSAYRVSRFWRTPGRDQWQEPENAPVIVQPGATESFIVDSTTSRTIHGEWEYNELQEEYCTGETATRAFEFRASRLLSNRLSTTKDLVLEGEAVQQSSGDATTVDCTQISSPDGSEDDQ